MDFDWEDYQTNRLPLSDMGLFQVEWSEINAAWGQTLLLIATVAEKLNFQFEGSACQLLC